MKVCAGIVLFNPEIERLKKNIDAVLPQVDLIVLVDNASDETDKLQEMFTGPVNISDKIIFISNDKNIGIAAALNQLIDYADRNGYGWMLTLDQDSVCGDDLTEKLLTASQSHNNVAMVSPNVIERDSNINTTANGVLPEVEEVPVCITSGCLTNIKAVIDTGGFNEWLFIDHVDHDMCIRLRYRGYRILKVNNAELHHEYGLKVVHRRIFFKVFEYHNYTPFRVYYQARNMLYMVRKYGADFKPHPFFHYFRPIAVFFIKFIFEPQRAKRLKAFVKGYLIGLFMKIN